MEPELDTPRFIALLDAWPQAPLGATFLTTYTFNGPFFESVLLTELLRRHASPIIVFVDRRMGYDPAVSAAGSLTTAGRDYYLVPVDWQPGVFHPKVHLFCGPNVALVGSGNLTPGGCGQNLEAFDLLDGSVEAIALHEIRQFFRTLLSERRAALPRNQRPYLEAQIPLGDAAKGEAKFLHTLGAEPLLERVKALALEERGEECLLAAPFQDYDHETNRALASELRLSNCRLAAEPRRPPPKPSGFVCGQLAAPDGRPLHAKLVYRRGSQSALLCLGSANLSRAAWSGRNAEAIVVRQTLEPAEFVPFIDLVPFESTIWDAPVDIESLEAHALPRVPQPAVSLVGDELVIELDAPDLELEFALDDGLSEKPLMVVRSGDSSWHAKLDAPLTGCAAVIARAPGHLPAVALVLRVTELRSPAWHSRLRRVLAREAPADDPLRLELLAQLGELLGRLHARAIREAALPADAYPDSMHEPNTKRENGGADAFELVDELEDILQLRAGSLQTRMQELRRLVSAMFSADEPADRSDAPMGVWSPDHLGEVTQDDIDDEFGGAVSDVNDTRHVESELSQVVVKALQSLARGLLDKVPVLAREDLDDALFMHETVVHLLVQAARRSAASREELGRDLIAWLSHAWAVARWPDHRCGWILYAFRRGQPFTELETARVFASVCDWLEWVDPDVSEAASSSHALDQASAVVSGVDEVAGETGHGSSSSVESSPEQRDHYAPTLDRIRRHTPRHERARVLLEPLWAMELSARVVRMLERRCTELRRKIQRAEAAMSAVSHRAAGHRRAAARKAELEPELTKFSARLANAERRLARAEAKARARDDPQLADLVKRWTSAGWGAHLGKPCKLVRPAGASCSACRMQFPMVFVRRLRDPTYVGQCINCGVLVANGPEDVER
jgi:hypothetical protein